MNYIHTNIVSKLTIKKQNETIAIVNLIDEPKVFNIKGELVYKTAIVLKNNLKQINN